ncbi:MAG: HEAT repeat domain-containing protein [Verrucomicrobia bacterium]|nr:HEAT repeat domain-containing protein [Verrucomicrobiota bacterium]
MNAQHARRILFVLVGICTLISLVLLVIFAAGWWSADEPTYEGKPVSVWFREYAYGSNSALPIVSGVRPCLTVIFPAGSGKRPVVTASPSTNSQLRAWYPTKDPAWAALQALGSNAVPCLVRNFRGGVFDRTYERAFTNLPSAIQKQIPNPARNRWLRVRAIDALATLKLGESGRAATPHLLEMLKQRDPWLRSVVFDALRSLNVDRRSITRVILQFGSQRKYADVVEVASQMGWEGDDIARLLGDILKSPDPSLRMQVLRLLERSETAAAPALDSIILALRDPDKEVRYLAARSIEAIGTNSPQVVAALRSALKDENVMVQIVARRTLTTLAPDAIPPTAAGEGRRN